MEKNMALINKIHYTYKDVTTIPNIVSDIEHRSECNPYDENGFLPLFTAPMDTVVNEENYDLFIENKIYPILPRTFSLEKRLGYCGNGKWAAFSLTEFEDNFINEGKIKEYVVSNTKIRALIDVANGHMKKILDLIKCAKEIYTDDIEIMAGNIANPNTYKKYAEVGCDYIRVGIGAGAGCLSTTNVSIHFPMASLVDEISKIKKEISQDDIRISAYTTRPRYKSIPKIIADGGIRDYSDVIKALALGADYVMIGSVFAKMVESAAPKEMVNKRFVEYSLSDLKDLHYYDNNWYGFYNETEVCIGEIDATFYGMASREGQIAMNGAKTKTSEGVKKTFPVLYTMKGWAENITDYIRSAMSYTGHRELEDFKKWTNVIVNSENAVNVINK